MNSMKTNPIERRADGRYYRTTDPIYFVGYETEWELRVYEGEEIKHCYYDYLGNSEWRKRDEIRLRVYRTLHWLESRPAAGIALASLVGLIGALLIHCS